ncbi:MAG: phosphoribosylaminoimidazolesuccinocarboxamide synthase [Saprospirales bacterium]|nr:MAG: phosphoribosylaminoimidazolesuccinocarboxamide synthase [Saprospirales bacterium]
MKTVDSLSGTEFELPGLVNFYKGKVRDVYFFRDKIALVATDRISAFDHILPNPIPLKGLILNQLAAYFLKSCCKIAPNWLESVPDPNVSVGKRCESIKIEMVIRGYLVGHAWRIYKAGGRELCGVQLPDGMKESEPFPEPIITPATKAVEGHDEDISRDEILSKGIVVAGVYEKMEEYTRKLFKKGTDMAAARGLILVDTKYEFGFSPNGELTLIDEIHTPDSSRYFYAESYEKNLKAGKPQHHLSKEFVREWLMENGFQGLDGQQIPEMNDEILESISQRYLNLYQQLTGELPDIPDGSVPTLQRVEKNLVNWCRKQKP